MSETLWNEEILKPHNLVVTDNLFWTAREWY